MGALITIKQKRDRYLELIAEGKNEAQALKECDLPKSTYLRVLTDDPDFAKQVEFARKHRAEHWIGKIAEDVDDTRELSTLDVPAEKLYFEKLQYLAKADNPDRYSGSGKGVNISLNLGEFKLLNPEDAKKALAADPFAEPIEAEFETIPEDGDIL
jgi:hypothetical protein